MLARETILPNVAKVVEVSPSACFVRGGREVGNVNTKRAACDDRGDIQKGGSVLRTSAASFSKVVINLLHKAPNRRT